MTMAGAGGIGATFIPTSVALRYCPGNLLGSWEYPMLICGLLAQPALPPLYFPSPIGPFLATIYRSGP